MIAPSSTNGVLALLAAALAVVEFLRGEPVPWEAKPGLLARARLRPASARAIALRLVPGGSIRRARIEVKRDLLIFSYSIKRHGTRGLTSVEVEVDAMTGRVVRAPAG
ncbi:MAG: PepSY domain-containing protein [Gemmatimonadota bacterium]